MTINTSGIVAASGRIDITAVALSPIHHGAGTSGNTSLLRMEEIVTPEGKRARVPFVSGNSLKHRIRDGGVRFALDAMGVPDGALDKRVVDLLFSGGHLDTKGAAVGLAEAREIARLFPILAVCGYSAGNFMQEAKISVDDLHVVCVENAWRLPLDLSDHPLRVLPAGALRGEGFGTRHEATRNPRVAGLLTPEAGGAQAEMLEDKAEKRAAGALAEKRDARQTSQMIYDYQTIKAGAVLWGSILFRDLTGEELTALKAALGTACDVETADTDRPRLVLRVGGKGNIGLGKLDLRLSGALRRVIRAPQADPSGDCLPVPRVDGRTTSGDPDVDAYARGLRERRGDILAALAKIMGTRYAEPTAWTQGGPGDEHLY